MNLTTATHYAEKISEWIAPYCFRVEIAGSVRRRRPNCNDIDLVCIPKLKAPSVDLTGVPIEAPENTLLTFLVDYVNTGRASWRNDAGVPGSNAGQPLATGVNFLLKLPKCDLDIFCANEATFTSRLMCRTGSPQHNIWLAQRAQFKGGHWNPQNGLRLENENVPAVRV